MKAVVDLLAQLTLTFLGFTLAVFGIVISLFSRGVSLLRAKYSIKIDENAKQIEALKSRIKEAKNNTDLQASLNDLSKSLRSSERDQKNAVSGLSFLKPALILILMSLPLFLAFMLLVWVSNVLVSEKGVMTYSTFLPLYLGLIAIFFRFLWKTINIAVLAKEEIDKDKESQQLQNTELLRQIQVSIEQFVRSTAPLERVHILVDGKKLDELKDGVTVLVGNETKLKVELVNQENKTAESPEMGFIFPPDFEVKQISGFTYFKDTDGNLVIRFSANEVHASTRQVPSNLLTFTPKTVGKFTISTFIKGKNVKPIRTPLVVDVVELTNNRVI